MTATLRRVERIAHRGASRERVENTLPAFELALERGADAVELDAHVTSDGQVVVHHDYLVGRLPIARTRWAELREVSLGAGATVPLLSDVLDAVASRATVYVEVKSATGEARVVEVVQGHGTRYALHSFDHECIARVSQLAPDVPRGVLLDRGIATPVDAMRSAVRATRARDVWPHRTLVDASFTAAARELGVRVIAWTVNSPEEARRLVDLGIDGVCTDDVRLLATL